jgi:hypothetical protein
MKLWSKAGDKVAKVVKQMRKRAGAAGLRAADVNLFRR